MMTRTREHGTHRSVFPASDVILSVLAKDLGFFKTLGRSRFLASTLGMAEQIMSSESRNMPCTPRIRVVLVIMVFALCSGAMAVAQPTTAPADLHGNALAAMKRATAFMTDKVSHKGGYVWSYLPDMSRRWGEMEAFPSMIWIQSGTPQMGQLFLNAYRATRDDYYYRAAEQVAGALIACQHSSGGWNYCADLDSEELLKKWYDTIGKNGWRLEEFQHYYGNATFDDRTTVDAAEFMLRMYLEKKDARYKASLDKAIQFVLDSQYPVGGWPQRFPRAGSFSKDGNPDYTGYITFNDEVAAGNIDFLIQCCRSLGDRRLVDAIQRGMNAFVVMQQPAPQAGWGLQHTPDDLKPAAARTYEPKALVTNTTASCIDEMIRFYRMTGDRKFLARIPEALDWLDSVRLPASIPGARGSHPTFVEVGTNKALFIHRSGSNVVNGRYFADYDPQNTIGHYSSFRNVNTQALRQRYEQALALNAEELAKDSPLQADAPAEAPRAAISRVGGARGGGAQQIERVISTLNAEGYWPSPIRTISHPYKADAPKDIPTGDFARAQVGDEFDTSPFGATQAVSGISTSTYIANMSTLIRYLEANP
jgi:PelA/Pel-15E family pectate lyase